MNAKTKFGIGVAALFLFLATIIAANYAIKKWGVVPVGFGLEAPAGVYFAGLAFTLRDIVHRAFGRDVVIAAIITGALLSWIVEANTTLPGGLVPLATASAVAFLISESADLLVYEPLSRKSFTGAVLLSNTVGLIVDSAIFLILAFGSLEFFTGQVVGKAWMTLLALPVLLALERRWAREAVPARY